jgi:thiamine biosynthesis lipoprotein ApbE
MAAVPSAPRAVLITDTDPTAAASWQALGMLVQLVVTDPGALDEAGQLLARDLAELDAACSRFRPDSEIVRIGRAAGDAAGLCTVTVSPLLAEAVAVALRAASLTNGDVDPTVGAAISALGYDRDFGQLPAIGPALPLTTRVVPGWHCVDLDPVTRRLTLPAGVQLDLGATVKGWAADRSAIRIAKELGCGVLVSLGGDTAVAGDPPEGGWRIRVQDVTGRPGDPPPPGGPNTVIAIRDGGLATSSTVARRWRRGGDVLHHILDPRTGLPAAPVWRTVSVAAATCADANTAATAAIIRGRPAPDWLASLNLPARLVEADGTVHVIAGWPADPGRG